jgi:hypothetical protein
MPLRHHESFGRSRGHSNDTSPTALVAPDAVTAALLQRRIGLLPFTFLTLAELLHQFNIY